MEPAEYGPVVWTNPPQWTPAAVTQAFGKPLAGIRLELAERRRRLGGPSKPLDITAADGVVLPTPADKCPSRFYQCPENRTVK